MDTRREEDSLGVVRVPADRYYGAQTARALANFPGGERVPVEVIRALGVVKKAAALVNRDLGALDPRVCELVVAAADEVIAGELDEHFPLAVWQSGSGTQTNMNVNEVIANRAIEMAGGRMGSRSPVHPNDHVNRSQSTNDAFPTAVHVAAVLLVEDDLMPAVRRLRDTLRRKSEDLSGIVKVGRTHLMDATPLTLGQEVGGWASQLDGALDAAAVTLPYLGEIALGGTAVGTGLNAPAGYAERVAATISELTGRRFVTAPDKFAVLAAHDAVVAASGALRQLATALMKIADDVRWLASGPRCGLGELRIPANEPGSSIMPGKVNPTQCEALSMACCLVLGNDVTIGVAGSRGNLELNVFKPLLAHCLLSSIRLLAGGCTSFEQRCARGIEPDRETIARHVERSLMLVTALAPRVGYDAAARIAGYAHTERVTLARAAEELGILSAEEVDELVRPEKMV